MHTQKLKIMPSTRLHYDGDRYCPHTAAAAQATDMETAGYMYMLATCTTHAGLLRSLLYVTDGSTEQHVPPSKQRVWRALAAGKELQLTPTCRLTAPSSYKSAARCHPHTPTPFPPLPPPNVPYSEHRNPDLVGADSVIRVFLLGSRLSRPQSRFSRRLIPWPCAYQQSKRMPESAPLGDRVRLGARR